MDRTLRPRNRRKTDQPSKYVQKTGEDGAPEKSKDEVVQDSEVEEIEAVAKEIKERSGDNENKAKGVKRKSPDETSEDVPEKISSAAATASEKPSDVSSQSATKESATSDEKAKSDTGGENETNSTTGSPPKKLLKREPLGPLLSVEEQKLMENDVLSLLKRFAPKYYVPLPKIWAIPKSQLNTVQKS